MVQNALITVLLTVTFGDALEQTPDVSRAESAPLRVTVTHFQDRTESDEYLWLAESLAEQMRSLLAAAGAEVVDYQHLAAVGQEQVIGETGLPEEHAERSAQVAAHEIAHTMGVDHGPDGTLMSATSPGQEFSAGSLEELRMYNEP